MPAILRKPQTGLSSFLKKAKISLYLVIISFFLLENSACSQKKVPKKQVNDPRPNILLILADDMGFSDLGCYGGEIETPNLDRLASQGVRFRSSFNCAKCAPTRASLLTGQYSQNVGVYEAHGEWKNCATIAEVLKDEGYHTLMTGKWHAEQSPYLRGFERHYGNLSGSCNHFNPGNQRSGENAPAHFNENPVKFAIDDKVYEPYTPEDPDWYSTDAYTNKALEYLDEYKADGKPFFLHLSYTAPHFPLQAPEDLIKKYEKTYMQGWDKLRKARFERLQKLGIIPSSWKLPKRDIASPAWESVWDKKHWARKMAVYAAMVDRLDQNIGKVLDYLEKSGKMNNTCILFLSDNGATDEDYNKTPEVPAGPVNSYHTVDLPWANLSNTPFQYYKKYDYEGGIASPFIMYWKGKTEAGQFLTTPVHVIDIMPTCLEIATVKYPEKYKETVLPALPGRSLLGLIAGEKWEDRPLFWEYAFLKKEQNRAVRYGKWKFVAAGKKASLPEAWELYDMENDGTEITNLVAENWEKARELHNLWVDWAKSVNAKGKKSPQYQKEDLPPQEKPLQQQYEEEVLALDAEIEQAFLALKYAFQTHPDKKDDKYEEDFSQAEEDIIASYDEKYAAVDDKYRGKVELYSY